MSIQLIAMTFTMRYFYVFIWWKTLHADQIPL